MAILDALALSLFPCPRVLRTRLGSSLFEWKYGEMIGHGVLLSRCPGISAPDRLLSPTAVGSLLGRLHADLLKNPPAFGEGGSAKAREVKSAKSPSESEDILRTGTLVAQNIRQQSASYAALLDQLVAAAAAPSAVTVEGVVHLDLVSKIQDKTSFIIIDFLHQNRTNFLYDEASETLSLVDFDFAMPGPLLLDVGFALVEYCCNSNHSVFDPDAASAFLRAYNAQRPFVAEELATGLKKHVALVWIRTLTWLWGSPHHWHRPELMQFGERVAPIIVAVLEWDASL